MLAEISGMLVACIIINHDDAGLSGRQGILGIDHPDARTLGRTLVDQKLLGTGVRETQFVGCRLPLLVNVTEPALGGVKPDVGLPLTDCRYGRKQQSNGDKEEPSHQISCFTRKQQFPYHKSNNSCNQKKERRPQRAPLDYLRSIFSD
jgi:hypothetical protein